MAQPKPPPPASARSRRSPCPVACALDLLGDRWTLLVVRDLLVGRSRFKEFAGSPEGIPTNLLSERLARLRRHGIVVQVTPPDGSKHLAYRLTAKGEALRPVLASLRDWGLDWERGTRALLGESPGVGSGKRVFRPSPGERRRSPRR